MTDTFTYLEVEAAMCVSECLDGWTLGKDGRAGWIELREGIGTAELRHRSIE